MVYGLLLAGLPSKFNLYSFYHVSKRLVRNASAKFAFELCKSEGAYNKNQPGSEPEAEKCMVLKCLEIIVQPHIPADQCGSGKKQIGTTF